MKPNPAHEEATTDKDVKQKGSKKDEALSEVVYADQMFSIYSKFKSILSNNI